MVTSVRRHFGPWSLWSMGTASSLCCILASGYNGISKVVGLGLGLCVKAMKCQRTEVTIHKFRPIDPTQIIAIGLVQCTCMSANYVVWDGGSGGLVVEIAQQSHAANECILCRERRRCILPKLLWVDLLLHPSVVQSKFVIALSVSVSLHVCLLAYLKSQNHT